MYNSNKRPRGDDWSSAQSGHAGYPGGGSWGGDQMYGGAINPSARDYGPANAAMGGGMAGMMSVNGGGGAAGMMAGAGGMPGGIGGSMSSGMGPGGMSSGMVGGGGGAGMMGHGGGMGMMPGSSMGGAGMMQQGGMGAASPMMGPAAGGGGGGALGSMTGSMGGGMATGQMGGMGGGMMGGMSSSGGGMGSMSGGHMGGHMGSHMGGGGGGGGMGVMGPKAAMMPQHGGVGGGGGGGMAGYEGGGGAFPAVRLRGLPFGVREDEVRAFLGCDTVDVLLTRKGGRPSGEAFVVLGTPYQVEGALQRNKSYLGRRYVEVFSAHKHEYYSAVAQYMAESGGGGSQQHYGGGGGRGMYDGRPDHREEDPRRDDGRHRGSDAPPQQPQQQQGGDQAAQHTGMLKLRGLPFSCTKADIMEWFTDLPVAPIASDGVRIVINADGRPSGMAFVEFASPADAATAMSKDRKMLGNRYVELFPSSREEATMDRGGRR